MKEPVYAVVRGDQVVGGPYRYKWVADGYCFPGEEVVEILPTDQGYEEFKSFMQ